MILTPLNILIAFDKEQKQSFKVGNMVFSLVPNRNMYAQDGKETNPVVAEVITTGKDVPLKQGDLIVLHHNLVFDPVYYTEQGQVIPYDRWVLATVDSNGELVPTEFNRICRRIRKPSKAGEFELPGTAVKYYEDRVEEIATGDIIGILRWADYEVIYNWNGEERRRIIVAKEHIISINMTPIQNYVAIRPDKAEAQVGQYIIPDSAQKAPKRGTVVAVGAGRYAEETGTLIPMTCNVGDKVLYSKFAGTEVEIDGEKLVIVKEYPEIS